MPARKSGFGGGELLSSGPTSRSSGRLLRLAQLRRLHFFSHSSGVRWFLLLSSFVAGASEQAARTRFGFGVAAELQRYATNYADA